MYFRPLIDSNPATPAEATWHPRCSDVQNLLGHCVLKLQQFEKALRARLADRPPPGEAAGLDAVAALQDLAGMRRTLLHHVYDHFDLMTAAGCDAACAQLRDCRQRIDSHWALLDQRCAG